MNTTVPGDRLFWSVIEVPALRAGRIPGGAWLLVEDDVPLGADQLWAVVAPVDQSRTAVCAIRKVDLTDLAPGAITLKPSAVPEFIPVAPDRFNFLIGEYEPKSIRRARLRRHIVAAACTALAAGLIAIGLSRRTDAWKCEAMQAESTADALIASIAPTPNWSKDDLVLELRQHHQDVPTDVPRPADAVHALVAVITCWPTQVQSKPQSISASGIGASVSVTVPGDAQTFLAALKAPDGWMLDEPRLAAIEKVTRLNLELRRAKGDMR